jgi:hypothetical protein
METHVRTHPNHPPNLKSGYREGVALQTLFSVFGRKYFEVEPALASTPDTDPLTHIIREYMNIPPGNLIPPISHSIISLFHICCRSGNTIATFREGTYTFHATHGVGQAHGRHSHERNETHSHF